MARSPLVRVHWLRRLRGRGSRALAAAVVVAGALAAVDGPGTLVLVLCAGVALVAAEAGGALPADRATGTSAWLAALSPGAAARRMSPALAGAAWALAVGAVAVVLGAAVLAARGALPPTSERAPVAVQPARVAAHAPARLDLGPGPAVVEIRFAPRLRDLDAAALGTTRVVAQGPDGPAERSVAVRGTVRLEGPGGVWTLEGTDARLDLAVVEAWRLGREVCAAAHLVLGGLLAAAALAALAPVAVLLSRGVSGPTAVLATAVLALVGGARGAVLSLAADAGAVEGGAWAGAVLRGAAALAPDLGGLHAAFHAAAGRAVGAADFVGVLPALAYGAGALALAALLPGREDLR